MRCRAVEQTCGARGACVSALKLRPAGKARSQTVAKVANRTREIRPSGMKTGAQGNVTHGGTRNPIRNRKSGLGHSPPTGARALFLSKRSFPLLEPSRSFGEPVTRLRRAACLQRHAQPVQNKPLHRGKPLARGTEVAVEGGEEVGGLHTSLDVGELVGNSDPAEQRRPV